VRLPGHSRLVALRVMAGGGDTVAFRNGQLELNGTLLVEPYVRGARTWSMPPLRVPAGDLFVASDNRAGPLDEQTAGRVPRSSVVGGPLW
jgi:signal peptidase I